MPGASPAPANASDPVVMGAPSPAVGPSPVAAPSPPTESSLVAGSGPGNCPGPTQDGGGVHAIGNGVAAAVEANKCESDADVAGAPPPGGATPPVVPSGAVSSPLQTLSSTGMHLAPPSHAASVEASREPKVESEPGSGGSNAMGLARMASATTVSPAEGPTSTISAPSGSTLIGSALEGPVPAGLASMASVTMGMSGRAGTLPTSTPLVAPPKVEHSSEAAAQTGSCAESGGVVVGAKRSEPPVPSAEDLPGDRGGGGLVGDVRAAPSPLSGVSSSDAAVLRSVVEAVQATPSVS